MVLSVQQSLQAIGDYFSPRGRLRHTSSSLPTGLALISLDYERESDVEFEVVREKLNKVAKHSTSVQHLLIWDRLHPILESPFHHIMQTMQRSNVQGLCIILRYTSRKQTLRVLRKVCSALWSKNTVTVEDQCCPPLPICIIVYAKHDKPPSQLLTKRLMLLEIAPLLPIVQQSVPKDMHFIKIKFFLHPKDYDLIADESALWLKHTAKRYVQYCQGRHIWGSIAFDKILRKERMHTWKNVGKSFAAGQGRVQRFRLGRSQSEPAIAPRRKPFIHDEIAVGYGEEAAAIAVQLQNYNQHTGIWSYKHPKTKYLHKVFLELVHLRESTRVKLIHRRQYFQRTGMHKEFSSPTERFYTRFQWIKGYSHDKTDQLIIYFHYGCVIQFNIARMKNSLSPCDVQILRNHLLAHSEAKKHEASLKKINTGTDHLWNKTNT